MRGWAPSQLKLCDRDGQQTTLTPAPLPPAGEGKACGPLSDYPGPARERAQVKNIDRFAVGGRGPVKKKTGFARHYYFSWIPAFAGMIGECSNSRVH